MKFKYIGSQDRTSTLGLDFERGKAVEVSDDRIIEKLKNNSQFEQVKRGRPRVVNES